MIGARLAGYPTVGATPTARIRPEDGRRATGQRPDDPSVRSFGGGELSRSRSVIVTRRLPPGVRALHGCARRGKYASAAEGSDVAVYHGHPPSSALATSDSRNTGGGVPS